MNESICDPPVGQRCAVGSRDLNLYIYIYIGRMKK